MYLVGRWCICHCHIFFLRKQRCMPLSSHADLEHLCTSECLVKSRVRLIAGIIFRVENVFRLHWFRFLWINICICEMFINGDEIENSCRATSSTVQMGCWENWGVGKRHGRRLDWPVNMSFPNCHLMPEFEVIYQV